MAIWEIQYEDGSYAGSRNSGDTADQAIAEWNEQKALPCIMIRFHDELLVRGVVRNLRLGMKAGKYTELYCDYYPTIRPATKASRMREVWMDAGYVNVPWVEAA